MTNDTVTILIADDHMRILLLCDLWDRRSSAFICG
jgi:hypothetical protein